MSRFEDELWAQLAHDHAPAAVPAPRRRTVRRPLALTAGSLTVAVVVAALVLALSAGTSPPAFAVTVHPGGAVTVTIRQISGLAGANRVLARRGIPARAVPLRALVYGCARGHELGGPHAPYAAVAPAHGGDGLTIVPARLPRGVSVLIGAAVSADGGTQDEATFVRGRARRCFSAAFLRSLPSTPLQRNGTVTTSRSLPPPRSAPAGS